jgi:hypothetical protein
MPFLAKGFFYLFIYHICSSNANRSQKDWKGIPTSTREHYGHVFSKRYETIGDQWRIIPSLQYWIPTWSPWFNFIQTYMHIYIYWFWGPYYVIPAVVNTRGMGLISYCVQHIFFRLHSSFLLGPALHTQVHLFKTCLGGSDVNTYPVCQNCLRKLNKKKWCEQGGSFPSFTLHQMQTVKLLCAYDMPKCREKWVEVLIYNWAWVKFW